MFKAGSAAKVINSEINNEYHGSDHCPLSLTIRFIGGGNYCA
jgi:exonuclease III